jgi:1,4-dihydroxy-6-naphthoate synthase
MKFSLGFSPCPNDTFIFDALVNGKIDTGGFEFEVVLEDVETLNQWALQEKLDITKLSLPAFFQSIDKYVLLDSGSALGKGVGPLLIALKPGMKKEEIQNSTIAIPGAHTTANLLFSFAFPKALDKKFMIFSAIENAVLTGETDLGVIIHENRFTYQQKGLHKIVDLGEYWEQQMKVPIPLGAIATRRTFEGTIAERISQLIRRSLEHAYQNYPLMTDYVKQHSQEMSEEVMRKHIDLYVNNYSLDLSTDGKQAIGTLQELFYKMTRERPVIEHSIFIS